MKEDIMKEDMNTQHVCYERFDSCYGEVTSRCNAGAFLRLENGQDAFAYKFGNLLPGTKVLCTVLKMPTETKRMRVSIDSVMDRSPMVA